MANTLLGKATIIPRGAYSAETEYYRLNLVTDSGNSYLYINPTPSTGVPLTDTSHWQQIASVGGQDLVDAAVAARDAAQGYKDAAAASAAQLAAGTASPAGTYADIAALNTANPDHTKIYITLDDGNWCYWNGTAFVAGGVYQATAIADRSVSPEKTTFLDSNVIWRKSEIRVSGDGTYVLHETDLPSSMFTVGKTYTFFADSIVNAVHNKPLALYAKDSSDETITSNTGTYLTDHKGRKYISIVIPEGMAYLRLRCYATGTGGLVGEAVFTGLGVIEGLFESVKNKFDELSAEDFLSSGMILKTWGQNTIVNGLDSGTSLTPIRARTSGYITVPNGCYIRSKNPEVTFSAIYYDADTEAYIGSTGKYVVETTVPSRCKLRLVAKRVSGGDDVVITDPFGQVGQYIYLYPSYEKTSPIGYAIEDIIDDTIGYSLVNEFPVHSWVGGNILAGGVFGTNADRGRTKEYIHVLAGTKIITKDSDYTFMAGMYESVSGLFIGFTPSYNTEQVIPYTCKIIIAGKRYDDAIMTDFYEEVGKYCRVVPPTDQDLAVPSYYFDNNYLTGKISQIETLLCSCATNGDAFYFITDMHWPLNTKKSPLLIKYLNQNLAIPRLFNGGDDSDGDSVVVPILMDAMGSNKVYSVDGNHEYIAGDSYDEVFYRRRMLNDDVVYGGDKKNYFYVDNTQQKIRYIVLAVWGERVGGVYTNLFDTDAEQLAWFSGVALDVDAGWTIIIFSHTMMLMNMAETSFSVTPTGAQAYIDAIENYAGNGEIACVILGHAHRDRTYTLANGVPLVITTCDKNTIWNDGTYDDLNVVRTSGTIDEQAFDVVVLDKTLKKLTFVRIGAPALDGVGNVAGSPVEYREVTYGTP